jgi:DNA-binding transcriptional ArsR family regulator
MGCCTDDELTQASARKACTETIHEAVEEALNDDVFGVLVDALPTLGKSRTVAKMVNEHPAFGSDGELGITVLTHRKETRNQIVEWADESGLDPYQLPIFDDDCPTANGEFGEDSKERVNDLRDRSITPSQIHAEYDLPCSEAGCPYMQGWEDCRDHRVLVGHPTHAYVPEVIRDRVVVFDENPDEAFRTGFDASEVHRIVSEYLADTDGLTWTTDEEERSVESADEVQSYRKFGPAEQVSETLAALRSEDIFGDSTLVGRTGGHGDARAVLLGLLEKNREDMGNSTDRINLPGGAAAIYDEVDGKVYVRRPPDLSTSAAVVGLDGTPILRIWEGRLGCPSGQRLRYKRVLCEDCRHRYLTDVLGYRIHQTSPHVKPYSSGHNINQEKDLALIEAVHRETREDPAVISTKNAIRSLEESWSHVQDWGHYGAIKGTNRFEGEDIEVGIVIGSQHPGDHEIKRLAALNGDSIVPPEEQPDRGKNLTYEVASRPEEPENPYLAHFRENQVVQAIFRFGRHDGATVFVHTGAVPDWILTDGPIGTEQEVFQRVRSDGERQVIEALETGGDLTVAEIVDEVDIAERTVYNRLDDLRQDGLVERIGDRQPYEWRLVSDELEIGHLVDNRYIVLPN